LPEWLPRRRARTIDDPTMFRYFQTLDPRRSLATAVAWFAVVLTLGTAFALQSVGEFASRSMLVQRDAHMKRFAHDLAVALDGALAGTEGAATLSPGRLAAIVDAERARAKPDRRARVVLFDDHRGTVFERPPGPPREAPPGVLPGISIVTADDGTRVVVAGAPDDASPALRARGLRVAVVQPSEESGEAGLLQEKLTAISILLSVVAALLGAAFARVLTRRLSGLTDQVRRVAAQQAEAIVEPAGRDEVAVLGRAFARMLNALRRERDELDQLSQELEQRVQARTREVERLAEDSRYAAVVRERLRLARDMHDTLAHTMMEMLMEVRTLRTLHVRDPDKLAAELERAEEVARNGLKEARDAVIDLRLNAVRDLGLGTALRGAANRFAERTGLEVRFSADAQAASFADPRAEVVFRIAEEALRNIGQHADASHVDVTLEDVGDDALQLTIADDGAGFDPAEPHPGHYGLLGIREQAQMIDAELDLSSAPGQGVTLRLRLRVGPEMRRP
jgi:signal transduction histidine kinase